MTQQAWAIVARLTDYQQILGFTCGRPSVDDWLHQKALAASPLVQTQLYVDHDESVVAFAATTMVIVEVVGGTSQQRFGSRDGESVGFMLAQMGVRSDRAGRGIGKAVVKHVVGNAAAAYRQAPFPLFVVDAADENLVTYYEQLGLRRLANTLRLVAPMRKIVGALPLDEPDQN